MRPASDTSFMNSLIEKNRKILDIGCIHRRSDSYKAVVEVLENRSMLNKAPFFQVERTKTFRGLRRNGKFIKIWEMGQFGAEHHVRFLELFRRLNIHRLSGASARMNSTSRQKCDAGVPEQPVVGTASVRRLLFR